MQTHTSYLVLGVTLLLSLANGYLGHLTSAPLLIGGGALGICYVLWRLAGSSRTRQEAKIARARSHDARPAGTITPREPVDPGDTEGLVEQMLEQGRFALLLRPQISGNLNKDRFRRCLDYLDQTMALVPDGDVVLGSIDEALDDGKLDERETASTQGRVIAVERFFLDRYPVTNRQYYEFVAGGGYEQMSLWDASILPAVLDLVDRTGMPGPRYWQKGSYLAGEKEHPVVGVSWYEACAYARWLGKRLPSDAEWVKSGSWPVALSATTRSQRKYPWGDTMDRERANLWGSGPEQLVPVDQFAEGVSVGGVYQLIGNVWEWTAGNFRGGSHSLSELVMPTPMKSIRGGAFDTYFDNQATCQFQSGENPLQRRHNIGFRCAVGIRDLDLSHAEPAQDVPATEESNDEQPASEAEEAHA